MLGAIVLKCTHTHTLVVFFYIITFIIIIYVKYLCVCNIIIMLDSRTDRMKGKKLHVVASSVDWRIANYILRAVWKQPYNRHFCMILPTRFTRQVRACSSHAAPRRANCTIFIFTLVRVHYYTLLAVVAQINRRLGLVIWRRRAPNILYSVNVIILFL